MDVAVEEIAAGVAVYLTLVDIDKDVGLLVIDALANFTQITPSVEMGVKPVAVVNTVKTQA